MRVLKALRYLAGRLALLVLGLVLALLVLEVVLQAAGAYTAWSRRRVATTAPRPGLRIMTLGDSNTYGLWVGQERAYPHLVQAYWNDTNGVPPIEVVNLGYPGTNSSVLRNRFPDLLRMYRPDVVTIMIGVNDLWTVPEPLGTEPSETLIDRLQRGSRVFRLWYMLKYGRGYMPGMAVERHGRWAPAPAPPENWHPQLRDNLDYLIAEARRNGVRPILLTYPSSKMMYAAANLVMQEAGTQANAPVINVTDAFQPACTGGKICPLLYRDQHPTVQGHQVAARRIVLALRLRNLLADTPVASAPPPPTPAVAP